MIIDSHFSKDFHSFNLNNVKYDAMYRKATLLRDFRNKLSSKINQNLFFYLQLQSFDVLKLLNTQIDHLTGQDIQHAIANVHTCYLNKFETVLKKLTFKIQTTNKINVTKYKVKTKNNVAGDIKSFSITLKSTPLSKILLYISKFESINQCLDFIQNKLNDKDLDENKLLFYTKILETTIKFSENRLFDLVDSKRKRLIKNYSNEPINFKELTYSSLSRLTTDFVVKNNNKKSIINCFLNIGGVESIDGEENKIVVPCSFSKKYHGDPSEYNKNNVGRKCVSYTVCFLKDKQVRVILSKPGKRLINVGGTDYLGVDVNVKHNMFALPDGKTFDYDRKIIDKFVNLLKHVDRVKEHKNKLGLSKKQVNTVGKQYSKHLKSYRLKVSGMLQSSCSELVKYTKQIGKNHLVLEDLKLSSKMFSKSDEFEGFNYGRLFRLLNLVDIKNNVKGIAYKQGVSVSFVHPHYTSQQCDCCGHISRENRVLQEEFKCVECGNGMNADTHAAINIENRCSIDVLRDSLLTKNKLGEYVPKVLSKDKIKETLLNCSYRS
jgi:IS605 OrfB family transposase